MRSGMVRRASLALQVLVLVLVGAAVVVVAPRARLTPGTATPAPTPAASAGGTPAPPSAGAPGSATAPSGATSAATPRSSAAPGASASPRPVPTSGVSPAPATPSPTIPAAPSNPPAPRSSLFVAPPLDGPLVDLDPGLAARGPRPTLAQLNTYEFGNPAVLLLRNATPLDWQLGHPDQVAVAGYADEVSVLAGQDIGLHLSGIDGRARLDVFRVGRNDARHMLTIPDIAISRQPEVAPRAWDGLVDENWPRTVTLHTGSDWPSGVYLGKLTGASGGDSYVIFIVRPARPSPITVVVPMMTYQAYNDYGGADLYGWTGGPNPRAYKVSFNRPYDHSWGAALFFRLDFPLIVWLEDHGYEPGYVADVDLARDPGLALGATSLLFSGHGEYWTGGIRDVVEAAAAGGTNLGFFGANQAFWQSRLEADASSRPDRVLVCYKAARFDPLTESSPGSATVRFEEAPVNRPPARLMGLEYAGVVVGLHAMVVGPGITLFDPQSPLRPGQELPGLIGDEVDEVSGSFSGVLLGATPVTVTEHPGTVIAGMSLWVAPSGNNVFDAGTFNFSWGLDPRYAAALPGFPAAAYQDLAARILAWLGARPAA
jgi:hypothetical protein